ncbi:hypothetical protein PoB_006388700 [Plakobranchus ocellatus]|uniref:Uncharacterized protein n=1 Tax=Plakobranchus ocellatus TaxID=259542 RepID=A0AAV4CZM7_9GAST|nr:hypothetical protein PoB_006388700 [Plakobranchus ocellatus]
MNQRSGSCQVRNSMTAEVNVVLAPWDMRYIKLVLQMANTNSTSHFDNFNRETELFFQENVFPQMTMLTHPAQSETEEDIAQMLTLLNSNEINEPIKLYLSRSLNRKESTFKQAEQSRA